MTPGAHHRRFGAVMWGAIGIALMILAVVTYSLDPRVAGYAVGIFFLVCLAVCGAAFWLDSRSGRDTRRLVDRLRRRSGD